MGESKFKPGTVLINEHGHSVTVVFVRENGYELVYDDHPEKSFASEGLDDPFLTNWKVKENI